MSESGPCISSLLRPPTSRFKTGSGLCPATSHQQPLHPDKTLLRQIAWIKLCFMKVDVNRHSKQQAFCQHIYSVIMRSYCAHSEFKMLQGSPSHWVDKTYLIFIYNYSIKVTRYSIKSSTFELRSLGFIWLLSTLLWKWWVTNDYVDAML